MMTQLAKLAVWIALTIFVLCGIGLIKYVAVAAGFWAATGVSIVGAMLVCIGVYVLTIKDPPI